MIKVIVWTSRDKIVGEAESANYISDCITQNKFMVLNNVRVLVEVLSPVRDRTTGEVQGMNRSMTLLPLDINDGPVDNICVLPMLVVIPKEKNLERLEALIKQAENNETASRALESGIHLAKTVPSRFQ